MQYFHLSKAEASVMYGTLMQTLTPDVVAVVVML